VRKPIGEDLISFIMIKKSLKKMKLSEVNVLINKLTTLKREPGISIDDDFEVLNFKQTDIKNLDNLMPLFSANNITSNRIFNQFLEKLNNNLKITTISYDRIKDGFLLPKGTSKLLLTRNLDESRVKRANLIIEKEDNNKVEVIQKRTELKIEINSTDKFDKFTYNY